MITIVSSSTLSNWTQSNATAQANKGRACGYNANASEIILLGGWTPSFGDVKFDLEVYSVINDTIQSLSPLPNTIEIQSQGRSYTQYNHKLYFVSNQQVGVYNMHQKQTIYPLSAQTIDMDTTQTCIAISDDEKHLFIIGGTDEGIETNKFQIYDIEQHSISYGPEMATIRTKLNCAVSNDYLYAIGGNDETVGHLDTIEKIYIGDIDNIDKQAWLILQSTMSVRLNRHECIRFNQYIYILGGNPPPGGWSSVVMKLDTDTDMISQDTELPADMKDMCGVVTEDERLFIFNKANIYWAQILTNSINPTSQPTANPTIDPTIDPTISPIIDEFPSVHPPQLPDSTQNPNQLLYSTYGILTSNFMINKEVSERNEVVNKVLIYIAIITHILLCILCISVVFICRKYYRQKQQTAHMKNSFNIQNENNSDVVARNEVINLNVNKDINVSMESEVKVNVGEYVNDNVVERNEGENYIMDNIGNDEFIVRGDDEYSTDNGNTMQ